MDSLDLALKSVKIHRSQVARSITRVISSVILSVCEVDYLKRFANDGLNVDVFIFNEHGT